MVNPTTETHYWAGLLTKRLAASPREQIEIAESAIRAGIFAMLRVKLNIRDQEVCLEDEISCIAVAEEHMMPLIRFAMDNALDCSFGPTDRSEELMEALLDEHFPINTGEDGLADN